MLLMAIDAVTNTSAPRTESIAILTSSHEGVITIWIFKFGHENLIFRAFTTFMMMFVISIREFIDGKGKIGIDIGS
jgi:hypothetical protein